MDKYYRHFKGGVYRLVGIAKDSETLEDMVVYQAMYGDHQMWVRPAEMFFGKVERDGKVMDRFMEVGIVDDRFKDAARLLVQSQCGLRSNIQRKLAISYARAGRILDQLEEAGIVGPVDGSLTREILVKDTDVLERILSHYEPIPKDGDGKQAHRSVQGITDKEFWDLMRSE